MLIFLLVAVLVGKLLSVLEARSKHEALAEKLAVSTWELVAFVQLSLRLLSAWQQHFSATANNNNTSTILVGATVWTTILPTIDEPIAYSSWYGVIKRAPTGESERLRPFKGY
jgi:hypothetical protein